LPPAPGLGSFRAGSVPGKSSPGGCHRARLKITKLLVGAVPIDYIFRLAYASSTSSLLVNLTALLGRGVSSFLARIVEQPKLICLFFFYKELTSL